VLPGQNSEKEDVWVDDGMLPGDVEGRVQPNYLFIYIFMVGKTEIHALVL
jgi:hypothetical protein